MADLTVELAGLRLKNPVMPGSGTWGPGPEDPGLFDSSILGAVVAKSVTLLPRMGNPPLRLVETAGGMLNSIGIPSPGIARFTEEVLPLLREIDTVRIISIAGTSIDEFVDGVRILDREPGIDGFELNLSCPNLGEERLIAEDERLLEETVRRVRAVTRLPLLAKLSPNVTDIVSMARLAEDAGADALTVANTLTGMALDLNTFRPKLGNEAGGLSGPAVKPVILRMVWQVSQAVGIPVVASGGIRDASDAFEFLLAGATAVQVGTANFINPRAMADIIEDLNRLLDEKGFRSVSDIVGLAWNRGGASLGTTGRMPPRRTGEGEV